VKRERGYECALALGLSRRGAAWYRQARQATNSQLSSRIYSRVTLAEPRSRNFAPALARRASARTRVMTFSAAVLKIAPRTSPRPFSPRPPARPHVPFKRPLSPGEIGRLSSGCLRVGETRRDVSADSATRHAGNCHGEIATSITEQSSSFAALLSGVHRRRRAISDEPQAAMGALIINEYCL